METMVKVFAARQELGMVSVEAREIPVESIQKNMRNFAATLKEILPEIQAETQGFHLKSFDVAVGVSAEGQVGFLGTGASLGAEASVTLTFECSA